jgi:hypothetical protein
MKQLFTSLCYLLLITGNSFSQSLSIDNIQKISLRNSGAIKEGTDVKGYYFFYVSDKIDKSTYEYTLQITDNTLKKLKDIKFMDSKQVMVLESSFNGQDLIFLLYNNDANTLEYNIYGLDGKKKYTYTRSLTKKEDRFLRTTYLAMNDDEQTYKGLYAIEGKGFISNTPSREDKDFTFQVDYFSSEKKKQWSYTPTQGAKIFMGDYLGTNNGVVYFQMLRFTSRLDQKPESFVIGLDIETGKLLFDNSTEKSKYKFYPASMFVLNGKSYMFGEFFDPNENIFKSNGFGFWSIDEKGAINSEKYISWASDLGKFVDAKSNGKIDDFGFMYLHNMIVASDGSIYAVGEGYKKVASALGIAARMITNNADISMIKAKVTDMILLKFDKDFTIKDAKIYEKSSNSVELPSGFEFMSTPLMGKLLKYTYGEFDYAYTQTNKEGNSFTICYADYVRGKDYKGSTFNAISYNDGVITTDKIQTKSSASRSLVLPASQGQVLIMEYFRKDKKVELHFEKLN